MQDWRRILPPLPSTCADSGAQASVATTHNGRVYYLLPGKSLWSLCLRSLKKARRGEWKCEESWDNSRDAYSRLMLTPDSRRLVLVSESRIKLLRGPVLLSLGKFNRILQLQPHPLSPNDHLVILSSDCVLRVVPLSLSNPSPAASTEFDLSPELASSLDSVVSFAFAGSDASADGWKAMTVYLLCKGGDVFSLCPVLPDTFQVPLNFQLKSLSPLDSSLDPQIYWTNKLVGHFESLLESQKGCNRIMLSLPTISTLSTLRPAVRGPFLQKPAPAGHDECLGLTVLHGGVGLDIIAISTSSSGIHIAVTHTATPLWQFSENLMGDSPLPNLHFLESISLPETPGYSTDVSLIRDPNYSDILFAKTEQSVYRIGFAEIMTALEKRTPVTGVHCTVDWLVNAAASSRDGVDKISAIDIVVDIFLGYSLLVFTASKFVAVELLLKPTPFEFTGSAPPAVVNGPESLKVLRETFKLTPAKGNIAAHTLTSKATYPEFVTEETLPAFCQAVREVRTSVVGLVETKQDFQKRLDLQRREASERHAQLEKIASLVKELHASHSGHGDRINRISSRNRVLTRRADILVSLFYELSEREQSAEEVAWKGELERMRVLVARWSRLIDDCRLKIGEDGFQRLRESRKHVPPGELGDADSLQGIHSALVREKGLIVDLYKRYQAASDDLSNFSLAS
ncbi:MAG: hypothetical protein SGCHY_005072 [Lobulomycetales sp.]